MNTATALILVAMGIVLGALGMYWYLGSTLRNGYLILFQENDNWQWRMVGDQQQLKEIVEKIRQSENKSLARIFRASVLDKPLK